MIKILTTCSIALLFISASAKQDVRAKDDNIPPLGKMIMTCPESVDIKFNLPQTKPDITSSDTAFKVWGKVPTIGGDFKPGLDKPKVAKVTKDGVLNMECTYPFEEPFFGIRSKIELYAPISNYTEDQCTIDQANSSITCK